MGLKAQAGDPLTLNIPAGKRTSFHIYLAMSQAEDRYRDFSTSTLLQWNNDAAVPSAGTITTTPNSRVFRNSTSTLNLRPRGPRAASVDYYPPPAPEVGSAPMTLVSPLRIRKGTRPPSLPPRAPTRSRGSDASNSAPGRRAMSMSMAPEPMGSTRGVPRARKQSMGTRHPSLPWTCPENNGNSSVSTSAPQAGRAMASTVYSFESVETKPQPRHEKRDLNVPEMRSNMAGIFPVESGNGNSYNESIPTSVARPLSMLQAGRERGSSARRKPRGARPPSIRVLEYKRSSMIATVDTLLTPPPTAESTRHSSPAIPLETSIPTPPLTADSVRLPPMTPSQLRAQLQKAAPSVFDSELPISPPISGSLKRSSHVRTQRGHAISRSESTLHPIVTDFSQQRLSLQPTSPLSVRRFAKTMGMHSPASSAASSPRETRTPLDSPVDWQSSPKSAYSTPSLHDDSHWHESPLNIYRASSKRGELIHVEWDETGYLSPERPYDPWAEPESYSAIVEVERGVQLKRQNTENIKELLRQRRKRAGLE